MTPKRLLFLVIILAAWFYQFSFIHPRQFTNDVCQIRYAAKYYFSHQSIYTPIPTKNCWENYPIPQQPNTYPPTTILLALPLFIVSSSAFTFLWDLFVPLFFLLSLVCFFLLIRYYRPWLIAFLFALSSIWIGLLSSYNCRNINLILMPLIFLAFTALRRYPKSAGFLIGIAALLKIWPVILLLPGLIQPSLKRFYYSGLLTITLGLILTLIVFKPDIINFYSYHIVPYEVYFAHDANNLSLLSLATKIRTGITYPSYPPPPSLIGLPIKYFVYLMTVVQTLIFLNFLISASFRPKSAFYLNYAALIIPLYLVFFPLSWDHGFFLLLFPLAILIKKIRRHQIVFTRTEIALLALGFLPLWIPYTPEILARSFLQLPLTSFTSSILFISLTFFSFLPLLINFVLTDKFSRS